MSQNIVNEHPFTSLSKLKNSSEDHSAVMDELAEHMQARHNLVIAKVDTEQVPEMRITRPSFKLFKTGNNAVVDYRKKTKTAARFARWLEEHCRVDLAQSNSVRPRERRYDLRHTDKFSVTRDEL